VISVRQRSYVDEWASLLDERVPEESGDDADRTDGFDWSGADRTGRFDRSETGGRRGNHGDDERRGG